MVLSPGDEEERFQSQKEQAKQLYKKPQGQQSYGLNH